MFIYFFGYILCGLFPVDYRQKYLSFFFIVFFFGKINKFQQRPVYHSQISFSNNNKPTKFPRHGRTTNLMWEHVQVLKDDDPRWLKDKITHQCRHCSWSKAVVYTNSNKNGIVTYRIGQVQRHLLGKHPNLDCCQWLLSSFNCIEREQ